MGSVKDFFKDISASDNSTANDNALEIYADSVEQALELAAEEFNTDVENLDYNILEKGATGVFGVGRKPYHLLIMYTAPVEEDVPDLDQLDKKFSPYEADVEEAEVSDIDSAFRIRVIRNGIWLTVFPSKGKGTSVNSEQIRKKLRVMMINDAEDNVIERAVRKMSGKPVRLGDWLPDPDFDGQMSIEVAGNEMKAYVHFVPPRYYGRHMEYEEVLDALRNAGVTYGYKHEQIKEYLEKMSYSRPLLAAEGDLPISGKDAYVEYQVHIDKSNVTFKEDESGKVDFKNIDLLENVTAGQLLAVKIPPGKGVPGRTVTDQTIPVNKPKDIKISFGRGTMLSDDGTELTAEINGQVVFKRGVISVEPIHMVNGDVGLQSGNIIFLGSVIITGNVQDNFTVKASGNIEVKGTVQKAILEAEGDIIIYQGIIGRGEAHVESTGGSVFAKFIQNANVFAEKDIFSPEGILHSNTGAGNRIICNGRRARMVGGIVRAENEINAHVIGANVSTRTEVSVGIHPKLLQKIGDLEAHKNEISLELERLNKDIITLSNQKASGKLSGERQQTLTDITERRTQLEEDIKEINSDLEERQNYIEGLEHKGKVCVENRIYPGVELSICTEKFSIRDEYRHTKFFLNERDEIELTEYEKPDISDLDLPIRTLGVRRRR